MSFATRSFKASIYNHFISLNGNKKLAYNAVSASLAVWEAGEFEYYNDIVQNSVYNPLEDTLVELIKGRFIVPEDMDERLELEKEYRMQRFADEVMVLTISPTLQCNLACDYCFQGKDKSTGSMSAEVQDKIVEMVRGQLPHIRQLHVAWYGGEPLLKLTIIKDLSERLITLCDGYRKQYSAMMVTNAYLLNLENAQLLEQLRVSQVQVTFDGPEKVHDSIRKMHSGAPTFRRIVENMQQIVEKVRIAFSVRVNVDLRNYQSIFGLIDALVEAGLNNRKNFQLYFAPIEAITDSCHCIADKSLTKAEYAEAEARLLYHAARVGLAQFGFPTRFKGSCAATRLKGFVINPDGDVHKCWDTVMHKDRRVGSVFEPDKIYSNRIYTNWLDWNPFDNEICRNCKIIANCAGACAYKFLYSADTKGEAGVLPCTSLRYNLNERLIQIALRTGYITQSDFEADAIRTNAAELVVQQKEIGSPIPQNISNIYQTIDR